MADIQIVLLVYSCMRHKGLPPFCYEAQRTQRDVPIRNEVFSILSRLSNKSSNRTETQCFQCGWAFGTLQWKPFANLKILGQTNDTIYWGKNTEEQCCSVSELKHSVFNAVLYRKYSFSWHRGKHTVSIGPFLNSAPFSQNLKLKRPISMFLVP